MNLLPLLEKAINGLFAAGRPRRLDLLSPCMHAQGWCRQCIGALRMGDVECCPLLLDDRFATGTIDKGWCRNV